MKLTDIKSQVNSKHRFSIYFDHKYAFSLSQTEIVNRKLKLGMEISQEEYKKLQMAASEDKLYAQTLKLLSMRSKSEWEVKSYLERKGASPTLIISILNKLSDLGLIDDFKFAEIYSRSIQLHSPASRRKILAKLKQKHVKKEAIDAVMNEETDGDQGALRSLIESKDSKYADKTKLMAYLSRQGFSYYDIKSAMEEKDN